jgi:hypothetical protein
MMKNGNRRLTYRQAGAGRTQRNSELRQTTLRLCASAVKFISSFSQTLIPSPSLYPLFLFSSRTWCQKHGPR